jgi:hypothetical protein
MNHIDEEVIGLHLSHVEVIDIVNRAGLEHEHEAVNRVTGYA